MANFATAADLAAMLQRTFTTDESAAAVVLLDLASAAIRGECHQTFDYMVGDVAVLYGTWASVLPLPERPVTAVTSVSLNGVALVADVDYWWPGRNFLARGPRPATTSTHDIARAGDWGGPNMAVTVTYTHGYQTIPGPVRAVCLMAASRTIVNPDGLLRQHLVMGQEGVDTFYGKSAAATTIDLSDVELRLLNPYRRSTWP